jgi:cytochrome c oxidase subunit 2
MGHATPEWVYVLVVIALLTWVGAESWRVEHTLEYAPPNSETVRVVGQQWFWSFEHADGTQEINELHLKTDIPYRFEIIANDVLHNFAVPDFAILMDAVPGRVNTMWNVFDKPGEYLIHCREYCGQGHQDMRAKLFIEQNNETTSVPSDPEKPLLSSGSGAAVVVNPLTSGAGEVSRGTGTETLVRPGTAAQNATTPASSATNASGAAGGSNATGAGGGPSVTLSIPAGAATPGNPPYAPETLTVKKGDAINVVNDDNAPHTATSGTEPSDPNAGNSFDTSLIMAGQSGKIDTSTLDAGDYPYHCTVHPFMKGTITVTA